MMRARVKGRWSGVERAATMWSVQVMHGPPLVKLNWTGIIIGRSSPLRFGQMSEACEWRGRCRPSASNDSKIQARMRAAAATPRI